MTRTLTIRARVRRVPRTDDDDPFSAPRHRTRTKLILAAGILVILTLVALGFGGVRANAIRTSVDAVLADARGSHTVRGGWLEWPPAKSERPYTEDESLRATLLHPRTTIVTTRPAWSLTGECAEVEVTDGGQKTRVFLRVERTFRLHFAVTGTTEKSACD